MAQGLDILSQMSLLGDESRGGIVTEFGPPRKGVGTERIMEERVHRSMIKVLKGDYECPTCKKLTTIGRTKKMDEPLTCCGVEMVPKEKTKFTEVPESAADESPTKKTKAKAATRTKKKAKKSSAVSAESDSAKRKKRVVFEATLPLSPGSYICQACGKTHELLLSDPRDKWLRCTDCFVKMVPMR